MHIIIIGGGNVGRHVAKMLLEKKQNVVLIEKDEKTVKAIRNKLDLNLICGNGANVEVLEKSEDQFGGYVDCPDGKRRCQHSGLYACQNLLEEDYHHCTGA